MKIYEYLATHKIAALIVASNFDYPADRVNGNELIAGQTPVCQVPTVKCPEHRRAVEAFASKTVNGLKQLRNLAPHVLVALPFPQQASLVDECRQPSVYQRIVRKRLPDSCGATSVAWNRERQGLIPDAIRDAVSKVPGVELWNPMNYFCSKGVCPAIIEHEQIMTGAIHWSFPAARFMVKPIAQFLDSAGIRQTNIN